MPESASAHASADLQLGRAAPHRARRTFVQLVTVSTSGSARLLYYSGPSERAWSLARILRRTAMLRTVRVLLIGSALSLGAITGTQADPAAQAERVAENDVSQMCGCCRMVQVWTGCCWVWVRVCD